MAQQGVQRRLAAILAADVVGYSRLMEADEAGTRARFNERIEAVVEPIIETHGGRLVKTMGDGFLVEFSSVLGAVEAAVEIQARSGRSVLNEPEDQRAELRIGIHLGDVIVEGEDIHGEGINIAARLETMAETGGLCVSDVVHSSIRNKLDIEFADLGDQSLKNIGEPVRVFAFRPDVIGEASATAVEALFRRPAVAVLPFENLSGDPDQEYFADGLTEDIITALSLWRSFPVIARHSTFAYKGTSLDIRRVGQELGARYVVEGSVRRSDDRVRVTAQLINAQTGHHVWAERYDRSLADIFAVQDELTQRISAIVLPEVERMESRQIKNNTPRNLDAWNYVLRGMAGLNEFSTEGTILAGKMFVRATELEPDYSRAYSGLARSYFADLALGISDSVEDLVTQSIAAAGKAVDLDDTDSLAHEMLGLGHMFQGKPETAVTEMKRAIELNPSNASAYSNLGYALAVAGKPEDGIPHSERGLELNPQDPRNAHYLAMQALTLLTAQRYDDAVRAARKAVERRADTPHAYLYLAVALGHLDRLSEAREALEACHRLQPEYVNRALRWIKFKRESDKGLFLEGLRKAGWEG